MLLFSTPAVYIEDLTVVTTLEGGDARVSVKVAAPGHSGKGNVALGPARADLRFANGAAEATLRVPNAQLWSPEDQHLYALAVTLGDGARPLDSYTLEVGLRTVETRGDRPRIG